MKILIAGLGSIGQRHARNLRAIYGEDIELLAYRVRRSPGVITERMTVDHSALVEDRYDIRSFDRLEDALAQRPDAAIVCNPSSLHVTTAAAALAAGCHVLIEKPLASSDAGVDDLIDLADTAGKVAVVGYQMRFHPALKCLRELIRRRPVGAVRNVRAVWTEYLPDAHPYEDYRQGYAARADLGGGVILCFIHEFDYLCWLFGMPSRLTTTGGRLGSLDIDVEDTAATVMEVNAGDRAITMELRQCYVDRDRRRQCRVECDNGAIDVDIDAAAIAVTDRRGGIVERHCFPAFERNQMFEEELRQFVSAIGGEAHAGLVTVREAANSLRLALAARQSLATGRTVELL